MEALAKVFNNQTGSSTTIGRIINSEKHSFKRAKLLRHKLLLAYPKAQFVSVGENSTVNVCEKVKKLIE